MNNDYLIIGSIAFVMAVILYFAYRTSNLILGIIVTVLCFAGLIFLVPWRNNETSRN